MQSVVLAREWLRSGTNDINRFKRFKTVKQQHDKKGRFMEKDVTYQDIANFLSQNGKAVSGVKSFVT